MYILHGRSTYIPGFVASLAQKNATMARPSLHITIPTPCHESWDGMDATAQGAFCGSCQKEVIDFTAMTDREILAYFQQNKITCGRFRESQVDRNLIISTIRNGYFKWKAIFISLSALILSDNAFAVQPRIAGSGTKVDTASLHSLPAPAPVSVDQKIKTDTTIVLQQIDVVGNSWPFREKTMTGISIMEVRYEVKPKTDRHSKRAHEAKYSSRREEIRQWFRRIFRIDQT